MCYNFEPLNMPEVGGWKTLRKMPDGTLLSPIAEIPFTVGPVEYQYWSDVKCAYNLQHKGKVVIFKTKLAAQDYACFSCRDEEWVEGVVPIVLAGDLFTCRAEAELCYAGTIVKSIGDFEPVTDRTYRL